MADESNQTESNLIDKANAAAERAEAAAARVEAANKKTEELLVRLTMSGRAEAGSAATAPKVETPKEYKDRILKGQ